MVIILMIIITIINIVLIRYGNGNTGNDNDDKMPTVMTTVIIKRKTFSSNNELLREVEARKWKKKLLPSIRVCFEAHP